MRLAGDEARARLAAHDHRVLCTVPLLVDHWDCHDWSQLWWVRAELRWHRRGDRLGRRRRLIQL